jgi:DNA-binding transcriptional regulator LsrR (DeoR family)
MNSFELEIDEKSRAGSEFMARVINEIRRAVATEKASRKLTQQAIAEKIGTSRAVINRQIQGLENLSARRVGEIMWAIGWEPYFEARKIPFGQNQFVVAPPTSTAQTKSEQTVPINSNDRFVSLRTEARAA